MQFVIGLVIGGAIGFLAMLFCFGAKEE